ncbi:ATP-binding protein [Halopseudomonas laoshanensis]|uniref:ATP-binding protein n=1 Tax=Halopseudomonas laoshanensis TaxID=2268758 RepID=UPI0037369E0C
MRSIGRQLGLGLIAIMLATVMLVGQGSVWLFDQALRGYLTTVLQRETDSLLTALRSGSDGLYLDVQRIDPDYQRLYSGRYFVIDAGERWRSRSLWDTRLPLDAEGLHNTLVAGPDDQQLLVWSGRYELPEESVRISVAIDYLPLLKAFDRTRWLIWGLGGAAILISLLVQQLLLRRALLPLRRARGELAEWHVGKRLQLSEEVPEELQPLVSEINHLGRQVEQIIKRSRSGQADLGHALKTPLAVLETLVGECSGRLPEDKVQALKTQLVSMRGQMERALQRARLAPESQAGRRFNAAEDLPWLLESLERIHGDKVRMQTLIHPQAAADWPFEREDMLELLGNLLDNACKWAATTVQFECALNHKELILHVRDDGPGVPEKDHARILRRGQRLDQTVNGQGLGLAIVGDLVEVYRGQVTLAEAALGGLEVTVVLPWQS